MAERYRFGLDPENKLGLKDDDVVSYGSKNIVKIGDLMQSIYGWSQKVAADFPTPSGAWFTDNGIQCEILRTKGGGWQKGRLRFRLEFLPDNPEAFVDVTSTTDKSLSPLDDLRSDLNI